MLNAYDIASKVDIYKDNVCFSSNEGNIHP